IRAMRERAIAAIEVRPERQRRYNERLQNGLKNAVWASGCASWYLDKNGKNTTIWPSFTFLFRARTRRFVPADYELTEGGSRADAVRKNTSRKAPTPSKGLNGHGTRADLLKGESGI
ncbi:MAG TPA: hypothetical protein VNO21_20400, partial [Polyangiaceae bacterium]|nr:hypothetical protein [Polyangiaceae bacterium]